MVTTPDIVGQVASMFIWVIVFEEHFQGDRSESLEEYFIILLTT